MATPAQRDTALLERLKLVVRDHPQAKLARATGRSRTALTRYMHGAKLPLEFGTALAEEFGVNPAWLLTGRGAAYTQDIAQTTAAGGQELLELMRSMDNVARVKLGMLSDHEHARALREVGEALDTYGSMRDKLRKYTAPILADLLEQATEALKTRNMARVSSMVETAMRLEEFCGDPSLSRRLLHLRTHVHHAKLDVQRALQTQLLLFQHSLADAANFKDLCGPAANLCQSLRTNLHFQRARQVARVALAFATEADFREEFYMVLLCQEAVAATELGAIEHVPAAIERAINLCTPQRREYPDTAKYFYQLYAGLISPREASGIEPSSFNAAGVILNAVCFAEDEDAIARMLPLARKVMNAQVAFNRSWVTRAELILKALRGKAWREAALEEVFEPYRQQATDPCLRFATVVWRAQFSRLRKQASARREAEEAQRLLDAFPPDRAPAPLVLAQHLRNLFKLTRQGGDTLRQKAEAAKRAALARGFKMVDSLE